MLLAGLVMGLFLIGTGSALLVLGGAAGVYYYLLPVANAPVTSPEVELAEQAPTEAVSPEVPPEDGVRFVSHLPGTKKLTVRCDKGHATGETEAVVSGEGLGSCMVIAIDDQRRRGSAVVPMVDKREYSCFQNGAKTCD